MISFIKPPTVTDYMPLNTPNEITMIYVIAYSRYWADEYSFNNEKELKDFKERNKDLTFNKPTKKPKLEWTK